MCAHVFIFLKKVFLRFKQRWFRARLQLKRFGQLCPSVVKTRREAEERARRRHRAARVMQRAVRRFLLRKRREKLTSGIVKIQVTEKP